MIDDTDFTNEAVYFSGFTESEVVATPSNDTEMPCGITDTPSGVTGSPNVVTDPPPSQFKDVVDNINDGNDEIELLQHSIKIDEEEKKEVTVDLEEDEPIIFL